MVSYSYRTSRDETPANFTFAVDSVAIGTRGEYGPEEIARCGGGMTLTTPDELGAAMSATLANREALGRQARENVQAHFTWARCGRATVAAYEDALR